MTIDPRSQANNRPFVPGQQADTTHTWAGAARPTPNLRHNLPPAEYARLDALSKQDSDAGRAAEKTLSEANVDANEYRSATTNDVIFELAESTDYKENTLSNLRNPTYKFRLFMTSEHDLVTEVGRSTADKMMKTLDSLPQVTIAESGVTAGFNIKDVEINQVVGPGFRNRSSMVSDLQITITEPLGSSLVESIINAGMILGVSNFAKYWYYLELSFIGYNEDGSVNVNPLGDMALANGGRWIYQIDIADMKMHMDDGGATYNLSCVPTAMGGFDDAGAGFIPENLTVGGGTINEFCNNLSKAMNDAWDRRYAGPIYTFKIINKPLNDTTGKMVDPGNFKIGQSVKDPIRGISLDENSKTPLAQVPRGTAISDILTFLYAHCEDAQKIMLDVSSPENLEDGEGEEITFNNKKYRVAMCPFVEADVRVTGYDPITNNYMKEITYTIWGYRSYTTNISPSQYENVRSNPDVPGQIMRELKSKGYLQKRYEYRFTGQNTDVIRFDLDFSFRFSAILPSLSGWRSNIDSVSLHEKYNPAAQAAGGSMVNQKNETALNPQSLNSKLSELDGQITELRENPPEGKSPEQIEKDILQLREKRAVLRAPAQKIREEYARKSREQRDRVEGLGLKNIYSEDTVGVPQPFQMSYAQRFDEGSQAAGSGLFGQWHRGSSLTGAMLNQIYDPINAMATVNLDIKGDPYWLSYSNIERRAVIDNPALQSRPDGRPTFVDGDSTFAMVFRFPSGIDETTGVPVIRNDDAFNGVYRVTSVKHNFADGQFKQTLQAIKLDLITPFASNKQTTSGGQAGQ